MSRSAASAAASAESGRVRSQHPNPKPCSTLLRLDTAFLEIVEDRYGRGATLITSQLPVDRWHDLVGDPTLADAILDRIIHNAHRIQLRGQSMRRKQAREVAIA